MSRKTRRREFVLGEEEILQLLDFDGSDEEALLEIDEEDEIVLAEALAESASGNEPKIVEIVDHDMPLEELPHSPELATVIGTSYCWTKEFPTVVPPEENPPNNNTGEWGKVMLNYKFLTSPATVFVDVCKLDELINNILVPQSMHYMHPKGITFETENEEIKAFLGISIMMSHHVLPEIHDYFSNEPDLRVQPIAETMRRDRFYSIRRALHFANQ